MVTIDDIKNYVLLDWNEDWDENVERWIEQITAYVEKYTGRVFEAVEDERVFDGNGKQMILIDDLVNLYSVEANGRELSVLAHPNNDTPKWALYSINGFPIGKQNIVVNGDWGYSEEMPDDIELAITILVGGIVQNQNKSNTIIKEKIGNYDVSYGEKQLNDYQKSMEILNGYKRQVI